MYRVYTENRDTGALTVYNFRNPDKAWMAFKVKGGMFGVGYNIRVWFEERKVRYARKKTAC